MFRQGFVRSQKFVRPTQQLGSLRSLRALTTSPGTALSRAYSKNHVPNASIYKNPLFKGTHISTLRQCYGPLARSAIYQTSEKFSTSSLKARVKTRDTKREAEIRHEILKSDPQSVSATSTVVPIFGGPNPDAPPQDNEVDMLEGLKSDLRIVRDTFKLSDVPKDVLLVGMGGIIPYVVTSFSTIGLAWELNYAQTHGDGYLLSHQTALELMHVLEPVQVGYGAVIISFLGAIHWGLEFAGYGGRKSRRRYAIGLLAPALAWPTILMPLHLALPTQFFGFTAIYFFDAAATAAGLAPPWYSTYRFVLTSIVGASLILTLIGRGQLDSNYQQAPKPVQSLAAVKAEQRENRNHEIKAKEYSLVNQDDAHDHEHDAKSTANEDEGEDEDKGDKTKDNEDEENEKEDNEKEDNQEKHNEDESHDQKSKRRAKAEAKIEAERERNSNSGSGKSSMESTSGGKHFGGVYPGDDNEAIRKEMRAKPNLRPAVIPGPEYGPEKKANIKPVPERRY